MRAPMGRALKYGNVPVSLDDKRFGSQAEARRWYELQIMERAGQIQELRFHPRYRLLEDFVSLDKERVQGIVYEADAAYIENDMPVAEDTKGVWTDVFKLKRKWFLVKFPEVHLRIIPTDEV